MLLPILAPNENSYPATLEAFIPQKVRKDRLSDQQKEALAKMKQYTDFNDLATKSVLGREGLERQVRPFVESLKEHRRTLALQERVQPPAKHLSIL
jgi:hypothetical protein